MGIATDYLERSIVAVVHEEIGIVPGVNPVLEPGLPTRPMIEVIGSNSRRQPEILTPQSDVPVGELVQDSKKLGVSLPLRPVRDRDSAEWWGGIVFPGDIAKHFRVAIHRQLDAFPVRRNPDMVPTTG